MKDLLIVGHDGSVASRHALEWAAAEADLRAAAVRVLSSYAPPRIVDMGYGPAAAVWPIDDIAEWTRDHLGGEVAATFESHAAVDYEFAAVSTRAETALLDAGERAALLVVGRSGAGAVERFFLGSVTAALLASSPCPVVVCPPDRPAEMGRVVVGTDGSEHADAAVDWAAAEAGRRSCELIVVHAEADHSRRANSDALLDAAVQRASRVTPADGVHVEDGAAQALLDLAESADLVVLGSRGRGGFRSMLFGSVAHAVAGHASCPAVIVR